MSGTLRQRIRDAAAIPPYPLPDRWYRMSRNKRIPLAAGLAIRRQGGLQNPRSRGIRDFPGTEWRFLGQLGMKSGELTSLPALPCPFLTSSVGFVQIGLSLTAILFQAGLAERTKQEGDVMTRLSQELDPQLHGFAASSDRLFSPAYDLLPPREQRRLYDDWCREWSGPRPSSVAVADMMIRTGEADIPVRLYRPREAAGRVGVVLYLHGGGWVLGDCDSHDQATSRMAEATGCAVLSVAYRLAPEHKFPVAFNDSYAALQWLAEAAAALDLDPSRLAVAGDSAGAALAAGICLAARDRGGPKIRFQALIYAALRLHRPGGGDAESPGLNAESMGAYARAYLARPEDALDPYAAPLCATSFAGLPPAIIASAALDILREDSEVYSQKLREAGLPVTYRCGAGLPHTYLRTIHFCDAARAEFLSVCAAIQEALQ
ncbi:MAG TPA: alpha/beta hydrolase [Terriglobia bacterium]|nr:alpha/beta hydrolase [Terriglobia bacterium]